MKIKLLCRHLSNANLLQRALHSLLVAGLVSVVLLPVVLLPGVALAQSSSSVRLKTSRTRTKSSASKTSALDGDADLSEPASQYHEVIKATASSLRPKKRVADEFSISVGQESYLNRLTPPAGIGDYKWVSTHVRTHSEGSWVTGYLEFSGGFAPNVESYSTFEVPEGYLNLENQPSAGTGVQARISVGRKRELWSQVDSDWALGLWQPLNRFDYMRPTEQGLTGAFFSLGGGGAELIVFGSTIYIPEQTPPFVLSNGRFHSDSPWFSLPADGVIWRGKDTDVKYELHTPSIGSVVNHGSAGLLFRMGSLEQGPFAQASFAVKPRNTIALPFEANLDLTDSVSYATVAVHPKIIYHALAGLDTGYRSHLFSTTLSVLREVVEEDTLPAELNHQTFAPMTIVSPKVEFRTFASHPWGPRLSLSYLHTYGGEVVDVGPRPVGPGGIFAPRTPYRQAVGLGSEMLVMRSGRFRLQHGMRWIEELTENGTVLMTDLRMHMGDAWRFVLSADVLGSRQPVDRTQAFISHYRGNDRVSGQLTYAF